ncbi:MAG TPA: hypothetical protein VMF06_06435, partial [Candidatus Limnocylindria bacterium]|nr:hypothetical protein [Candidatus Limnocylindria bacterium]
EVRSAAYLEKGNTAAASQDIETVERLAQSLDSEPLLISMLVEFAVQSISSRMIWQGLVDHRWDEAQLAHFQDLFARRTDPLQRCLTSLRAERAFSASAIDDLIKDPRRESALASESGDWRNTVRFIPRGWLRQNQVSLAGYYDGVIHQLEQGGNMEQVLSAESSGRRYLEGRPRLYAMFANMLAAAIDKADTKSFRMQALNRMGQTACALERFRRTSGVYPETLDKLTPKYLASAIMDPASHKPFRYEPQGDEWYRLYSLGANSRDDGGKPSRDEKGGDWCWPEPVDMKPRLF